MIIPDQIEYEGNRLNLLRRKPSFRLPFERLVVDGIWVQEGNKNYSHRFVSATKAREWALVQRVILSEQDYVSNSFIDSLAGLVQESKILCHVMGLNNNVCGTLPIEAYINSISPEVTRPNSALTRLDVSIYVPLWRSLVAIR